MLGENTLKLSFMGGWGFGDLKQIPVELKNKKGIYLWLCPYRKVNELKDSYRIIYVGSASGEKGFIKRLMKHHNVWKNEKHSGYTFYKLENEKQDVYDLVSFKNYKHDITNFEEFKKFTEWSRKEYSNKFLYCPIDGGNKQGKGFIIGGGTMVYNNKEEIFGIRKNYLNNIKIFIQCGFISNKLGKDLSTEIKLNETKVQLHLLRKHKIGFFPNSTNQKSGPIGKVENFNKETFESKVNLLFPNGSNIEWEN